MEPLPRDVPSMTNPNPIFMHVTPLVAIRLQSNTDFDLNGAASVQYTLPAIQYNGRVFALQLYNESVVRGKRTDQLLGELLEVYDAAEPNGAASRSPCQK